QVTSRFPGPSETIIPPRPPGLTTSLPSKAVRRDSRHATMPTDPTTAALTVARRLGLAAERAAVVNTGTHVLVRLEPAGVAARVTGDGLFAQFAGDLDTEVRVAAALHAAGAPVVPPAPGVPARAHPCGERTVTLWKGWAPPEADEPAEAAAGRALAACHRALATV